MLANYGITYSCGKVRPRLGILAGNAKSKQSLLNPFSLFPTFYLLPVLHLMPCSESLHGSVASGTASIYQLVCHGPSSP